ncbi:DNA-processing protein DprA [Sphaerochaeta sp. PS]|uniref:DNA-processing protein DprA n=1 Tax=Sphaerochaeta sp. PS TaxID=3076336 RepID=UPI0028A3AC41|nr:DNA-processing protein DprA [Sphaerochaeta sp. PS]MDT4762925.1 DNA-processing protein DprA [Sphaerochaeta sp. PS]
MKLSLLLAISLLPLRGRQMLSLARENPSPREIQRRFPQYWQPSRVERMLSFLHQGKENHIVFLGMEEYPSLLAQEENPPFRLLYRGRLPGKEERLLSLCGTRSSSLGAEQAAYHLALEAGANQVALVTSHSPGIDRSALYAIRDGHGCGFVPCDCGLDTPRIRENRLLEGMNLISSYEPDDRAHRFRCLSRNVLTAALSPLLVVVQAPLKSGALHCASMALDMGREVVVHSCGTNDLPWSAGSRQLAEDGAPVVSGYAEIASALHYPHSRVVSLAGGVGAVYRYGNSCYSISHGDE